MKRGLKYNLVCLLEAILIPFKLISFAIIIPCMMISGFIRYGLTIKEMWCAVDEGISDSVDGAIEIIKN